MKLKRIIFVVASLTLLLLCYLGYGRYCYRRSLASSLPNKWATLDVNFTAVSADVQQKFPVVLYTGHYDWTNGYMMSFSVHPGTTRAQAKQIVSYAYPRWVMIRQWAHMDHASECNVSVFGDDGKLLSPE